MQHMASQRQLVTAKALIDAFTNDPTMAVSKAAKIAKCSHNYVYKLAKMFPELDTLLKNKPSARTGPNKGRKILPAGTSAHSSEDLAEAEERALRTLMDICDDEDAVPRDRAFAASKLLGYCSKEREKKAREVIVTHGTVVELREADEKRQLTQDPTTTGQWDPDSVTKALTMGLEEPAKGNTEGE